MLTSCKRLHAARVLLLTLPLATMACAMSPPRSLAPDDAEAPKTAAEFEQLGDAAYYRGDKERALVEYVKGLTKERDNAEVLFKVATIHREMGRLQVAQRAYAQVLEIAPDHAGALEGEGLILLRQHLYDQAEAKLRRASETDPARWQAFNALGIIADIDGDPEEAEAHYLKALARQPQSVQILNNLGYSSYLAGNWDAARKYYLRALDIDRGSHEVWSNLGLLNVRQGRHDEAVDAFKAVMKPAEALNAVGYLCLVAGEYEIAKAFLKRAIEVSPTYYVEAYQNLARVQSRMKHATGGSGG